MRASEGSDAVDGAVEWRGALSHDDAVRAIRDFDIAVLPSTLPTGAPMKLSEYAAMARPMIAPDHANIRDLFNDREEIVLVSPGSVGPLVQAIGSLAADPAGAQRLGRAARQRVEGRTWEHTIDVLLRRALPTATRHRS